MRFIVIIPLLLILTIAYAHEESTFVTDLGKYKVELIEPKSIVSTGVGTTITLFIEQNETPAVNLSVKAIMDPNIIIEFVNRGNGEYYTEYNFLSPGLYEIHTISINNEDFPIDIHIKAQGLDYNFTKYLPFVPIIFGFVGLFYFGFQKRNIKLGLGLFVITVVIAGLAYSVYVYFSTGAAAQGVLVCDQKDPTNCLWQAHIHAYIIPLVCGEEQRFPIEEGPLNGPHTHEEKNVIHWHDRIPYNLTEGRILNTTPLELGTFFDNINVNLNSTCFYGKCNGDLCQNGKNGSLKAFVNKENYWTKNTPWVEISNIREYVWSDREIIYLTFDTRSSQEIIDYLKTTQFSFPTLGPA